MNTDQWWPVILINVTWTPAWVSGWTYQWIYNIHVNGWKTWYMPSAVQSLFWGVWNFVGFLKERQFREHTNSEAMYLEQYLEFILVDKSICISADTCIPRNQAPHKSDLTVKGRNNFVTRTTLTPLYDSMNTGIAYKVNVCLKQHNHPWTRSWDHTGCHRNPFLLHVPLILFYLITDKFHYLHFTIYKHKLHSTSL